jgi:hypothetical protein
VAELLRRRDPDDTDPDDDPDLTAQLLVAMVEASVHDVILRRPHGADRDAATTRTVELVRSILAV